MFSFRLGSIPVIVHPGHLLLGAILGVMSLDDGSAGWPGTVLSNPDDPRLLLTRVSVVLIWVGIVFVSVLFHELGHAVAFRAFHYHPTIQLVFFGGVTSPNTRGPLPWGRDVVSTVAGPLFGASLGLLCWALLRVGSGDVLRYVLGSAFFANL